MNRPKPKSAVICADDLRRDRETPVKQLQVNDDIICAPRNKQLVFRFMKKTSVRGRNITINRYIGCVVFYCFRPVRVQHSVERFMEMLSVHAILYVRCSICFSIFPAIFTWCWLGCITRRQYDNVQPLNAAHSCAWLACESRIHTVALFFCGFCGWQAAVAYFASQTKLIRF